MLGTPFVNAASLCADGSDKLDKETSKDALNCSLNAKNSITGRSGTKKCLDGPESPEPKPLLLPAVKCSSVKVDEGDKESVLLAVPVR